MKNTLLSGVYGSRIHPDFDGQIGLANDLCLIHYSAAVVYGPKIQPICIQTTLPEDGHHLWTAGYGAAVEGAAAPEEQLKEALTPIRNIEKCKDNYISSGHAFDEESMFCTGSVDKKAGACRGDTGGPVIDIIANGDGTITKGSCHVYAMNKCLPHSTQFHISYPIL